MTYNMFGELLDQSMKRVVKVEGTLKMSYVTCGLS